jgi:hypothetical protein
VIFTNHRLARDAYIWNGYMTAGAALVDETERRPVERDVLVYPILFNYRHGLEVAMKWMIGQYGGHFGVYLDKKNHDLLRYWEDCKKILDAAAQRGEIDDAIFAVERIVSDFNHWDKSGEGFRYSTRRDGVFIPLPDDPIDLENMRRVMEAVDNFFKGAGAMLHNVSEA